MNPRFLEVYELTSANEGGYSNHKEDNGGATWKGATLKTVNRFRESKGLPHVADPRDISDEEHQQLFYEWFYVPVRGDELPPGVAYAVFDAAIMSGPGRAVRFLQKALGLGLVDGVIGPDTMTAVRAADPVALSAAVCRARLSFCRSLSDWRYFGGGWKNRIERVKEQSMERASGILVAPSRSPLPVPRTPEGAQAKASVGAAAKEIVKDPKKLAGAVAAGAVPAQQVLRELSDVHEYVAMGLGAGLFLAGAGAIVYFVRRSMDSNSVRI